MATQPPVSAMCDHQRKAQRIANNEELLIVIKALRFLKGQNLAKRWLIQDTVAEMNLLSSSSKHWTLPPWFSTRYRKESCLYISGWMRCFVDILTKVYYSSSPRHAPNTSKTCNSEFGCDTLIPSHWKYVTTLGNNSHCHGHVTSRSNWALRSHTHFTLAHFCLSKELAPIIAQVKDFQPCWWFSA